MNTETNGQNHSCHFMFMLMKDLNVNLLFERFFWKIGKQCKTLWRASDQLNQVPKKKTCQSFGRRRAQLSPGGGALYCARRFCSRRGLVNSFRRPTRLTRRHNNVLCIRGLSARKSSGRHLTARAVRLL